MPGQLANCLGAIWHNGSRDIVEYHGDWGSLCVSRSMYGGFQPCDTERHLFLVIGAPVLHFTTNTHLAGDDSDAGTRRIMKRWLSGDMAWQDDLSGPFVVLCIDKTDSSVTCVTDLMLFIPVYKYFDDKHLVLGSHVDATAGAAGEDQEMDDVSIADFLKNSSVTWPNTFYTRIRQLHPSAAHCFQTRKDIAKEVEPRVYWMPEESDSHSGIRAAARKLREDLVREVALITEGMEKVAQFISGGVDSRIIAGLLPQNLERHGYIFLDTMNREGRIAQRAARAYGLEFHPAYRSRTHYLDILPEASDLIGSGQQYMHAHSLVFNRQCGLDRYQAVFGGYSADVFLKGYYAESSRNADQYLYNHDKVIYREGQGLDISNYFTGDLRTKVFERRLTHLELVKRFRPETATEWARFWPASNRTALPNLITNRRLFRSYELFLSNPVVKTSALAPSSWKENQRLFHLAFRPFLEKSRWLIHNDGHFPYFSSNMNRIPEFFIELWRFRKKFRKTGVKVINQGPWGSWKSIRQTQEWDAWLQMSRELDCMPKGLFLKPAGSIACNPEIYQKQIINLIQVSYFLSRKIREPL